MNIQPIVEGDGEERVKAFTEEIWHLAGERLAVRWRFLSGVYLEDETTGSVYWLGGSKWQVLSPSQQESICRGLHREAWIALLGLGPAGDDD